MALDIDPRHVFRDFKQTGNPGSGLHNPVKAEIRALLYDWWRTLMGLAADAGDIDLPNLMIHFTVTGGTANAITATPDLPLPGPGTALMSIITTVPNTGNVTINGKQLLTSSGNQIAPGGLTPGTWLFMDAGSTYRLVSDQASAAIVAAAEQHAEDAETAAIAAISAAGANISMVDSRQAALGINFPSIITYVRTAGYASAGDGGDAIYKKSASEPTHAGKFQSADGAWWELVPSNGQVNTRQLGLKYDGTTETTALQAAVDYAVAKGTRLVVSPGTILAGVVTIDGNVEIYGHGQATLKLPDNAAANNASMTGTTYRGQLEIITPGTFVTIDGIIFDCNEAGQSMSNPTSAAIRFAKVLGPRTAMSRITVRGCIIKNICSTGIYVKGDTRSNEPQVIEVVDCTFFNSRYGLGRDDPSSASNLGFTPCFIDVMDATLVKVHGCSFKFTKAISTGLYAPVGIRLTYNESTGSLHGANAQIEGCDFEGCGRGDEDWDGGGNNNNGLGCVDFYGRADAVTVANCIFRNCYNSGVRGKTNVRNAVVTGNLLDGVPYAISIVPTTTDDQTGRVVISNNQVLGAEGYGIAVIGNGAVTPLFGSEVVIEGNSVVNTLNQRGEALLNNTAGILVRYYRNVVVANNVIGVTATDVTGILIRESAQYVIRGNSMRAIGGHGIAVTGASSGAIDISGNSLLTCTKSGIIITAAATASSVTVHGNNLISAGEYGIDLNIGLAMLSLTGNAVRSQAAPATYAAFRTGASIPYCTVVGNVTNNTNTPYTNNTGAGVKQAANSWS